MSSLWTHKLWTHKILVPIACLTVTLFSGVYNKAMAQAWPVTAEWTDRTEDEYSEWVKQHATVDFFNNPNKVGQGRIGVDCAKAAFVMRAAFAAEKGLPFKFIGHDRKLYDAQTHKTNRTDPEDRILSFLATVASYTSVAALEYNSFPIVVNPKSVKPGVVYSFQMPGLAGHESGRHTFIVRDVLPSGMIHFIWATVPASTRNLTEFITLPEYMPLTTTIDNQWGFRRFFQPDDYERFANRRNKNLTAELKQIPSLRKRGFNPDDQVIITTKVVEVLGNKRKELPDVKYVPPVISDAFVSDNADADPKLTVIPLYHEALVKRLETDLPETAKGRMERIVKNMCFLVRDRIGSVAEGYNYYWRGPMRMMISENNMNRCPSEQEIYNYTTPNRDDQIRKFIISSRNWLASNQEQASKEQNLYNVADALFNAEKFRNLSDSEKSDLESLFSQFSINGLEMGSGGVSCNLDLQLTNGSIKLNAETLSRIIESFQTEGMISSEPWTSLERRWGMVPSQDLSAEASPNCALE